MARKSKKTGRQGPLQVIWENPPGPDQGVEIRRIIGGQEFYRWVDADGVLTPAETACALGISRVYVYRLVREGRLDAISSNPTLITLDSIKEFDEDRWQD